MHRRNRDGFNLVAMEAKKGPETDSDDREKVHALLSQREYKYQCGVPAVTRRLRLVTSTRQPARCRARQPQCAETNQPGGGVRGTTRQRANPAASTAPAP